MGDMCLAEITKNNLEESEKTGFGYKAMLRDHDTGILETNCEGFILPQNRHWVQAEHKEIMAANWTPYLTGFHIFEREADAIKWGGDGSTIVKVEYRGARLRGLQRIGIFSHHYLAPVIVADEMRFVEITREEVE